MNPKRFVIYNRVSREAQEDNTSLATQEAHNRSAVAHAGGVVVAVLNEVMSGSLYLARTQLQSAIVMIERGEADGLAMLDLERFARHAALQEIAIARIQRAGGAMLFCRDEFEATPEGTFYRIVRGAASQLFREKQRILSMEGHAALALAGIAPNRNKPPYAYRITQQREVDAGTESQAGRYRIVHEEAPWAQQMFEWRAQGALLREVAAELQGRGAPTRTGVPWSQGVVAAILGNSVYRGQAVYGRWRTLSDEERLARGVSHLYRVERPREEWVIIPTPPLVSAEVWERCQTSK